MSMEIMNVISNPDDFARWDPKRKLDRYRRVMEWHDHIRAYHKKGKVPWVWGSHQLLSRVEPTGSQGVLVAVYRVEDWAEYDHLMTVDDPLRDVSTYATVPLT